MIESVSQIGSKITACCYFMQPINNRLVPKFQGATRNEYIPNCCNFISAFFYNFSGYDCHVIVEDLLTQSVNPG